MNFISNLDPIRRWYNKNTKLTESTINGEINRIDNYFRFFDIQPDAYFDSGRNYKEDVIKFFDEYVTKNNRFGTHYAISIKRLFEIYEVEELSFYNTSRDSNKFWGKIENKRYKEAYNIDDIPTKEEIKRLYTHSNTAYEKAIILFMLSSGIRTFELFGKLEGKKWVGGVKLEDIDGRVVKINRGKGKKRRVTFISAEAKRVVEEWLNVREDHIRKIEANPMVGNMPEEYKNSHRELLFPYTSNYRKRHIRMLKQANLDDKTQTNDLTNITPYKFHPHTFRKWFITQQRAEPGCNLNMVHAIVGHMPASNSISYLASNYDRQTISDLKSYYDKHMACVTVIESPPPIDDSVEELRKRIEVLENQFLTTILTLQERI